MDVAVAAGATFVAFATIAVMAYLAVRPERPGPSCPRCRNRVKPADVRCRACRFPLGSAPE